MLEMSYARNFVFWEILYELQHSNVPRLCSYSQCLKWRKSVLRGRSSWK